MHPNFSPLYNVYVIPEKYTCLVLKSVLISLVDIKRIMLVFGTRPEAIKMCPLVNEFKNRAGCETMVCVSGQHRQMLQTVLDCFDVIPDYNLEIMKEGQTLFDITVNLLQKIKDVLQKEKPDIVLVHGDTSTTYITALACFYLGIKIGHVEAGLRTYNLQSPFPEEFNRQSVGLIADYNFAPTKLSAGNLIKEGKSSDRIFITGNTVIDALKTTVIEKFQHPILEWVGGGKLVLLTAHRRENLGDSMKQMFIAIKKIVEEFPNVKVVYPIHMNPKVREIANEVLKGSDRIKLIEPLDVLEFHNLMSRAYIVLTDSGGIQEEAPSFGIPVLVLRDTTERPEGIQAGTLKLVGVQTEKIYLELKKLLTNKKTYKKMSKAKNPYGDGFASKRIVDILMRKL